MNEQWPVTTTLDASGLRCPLPLLKAKLALNELTPGQVLEVIATDAGSRRDFGVFANLSGNRLLKQQVSDGRYYYWIRKKSG
ncbi:sulfurtransferase TusA family protein [Pseudomonas sp. XS1P51]